jgi:hypothetical protein
MTGSKLAVCNSTQTMLHLDAGMIGQTLKNLPKLNQSQPERTLNIVDRRRTKRKQGDSRTARTVTIQSLRNLAQTLQKLHERNFLRTTKRLEPQSRLQTSKSRIQDVRNQALPLRTQIEQTDEMRSWIPCLRNQKLTV